MPTLKPTSLAELPTAYQLEEIPGQPLYWGAETPPHIDQERVMANLPRLQRTLHRAGMSSVVVYPSISQPSGYLSSGEDSAALHRIRYSPDDRNRRGDRRWPQLWTVQNDAMIELKSQTAKGRTPEQKWANASDAALRDSIRAGAYDHMMGHDSFDQLVRYVAYAIYAIHPVGTAMLAYNEGAGLACLAIILAGHIGIRGIIAKANKKETGSYEFDRVRWDIAGMDGIAPDRYALTRVATAIPRLLYAKK